MSEQQHNSDGSAQEQPTLTVETSEGATSEASPAIAAVTSSTSPQEAEASSSRNVGGEIPKTMKAALYTAYGAIDNVVRYVEDFPVPQPAAGQVLIKVHAASINPVDWKIIKGNLSLITGSSFPKQIGFDFSGVVVSEGSNCKKFKVGDEVFGKTAFPACGSCAEYVVIHESILANKPKNLKHDEAATLPLVGLTVYQSLVDEAKLIPGQSVLILGGSGGTGTFAIQLAKNYLSAGRIITTCSGKNAEFVKSLGADEVIDYTQEKWNQKLRGQNIDVVFDCVGGPENSYDLAKEVLKPGREAAYVTIAPGDQNKGFGFSGIATLASQWLGGKFSQLIGGPRCHLVSLRDNGEQLNAIKELAQQNRLKPLIDQTYSLQETKEALLKNQQGRTRGKIVVKIVHDPPADDFQL